MKNYTHRFVGTLALLAFFTLNLQPSTGFAQNAAFTYQGRITDNGTNFTGTGQFKFALVTSSNASHQATATATITSDFVTGISVVNGGSGYTMSPTVTISGGGGSGATATATISGGVVTGITVGNAGSGYTGTPTVTVAPPPANMTYTTYWSNDGTSVAGSEPAAAVSVPVQSGLFTVVLGDTSLANMTAVDAALFQQSNLQLRIWFNDGTSGFAALSPLQNLTPTPYAIRATTANGLPGLSIYRAGSGGPDVIGGAPVNFVASGVLGATIGGGGAQNYGGADTYSNRVTSDFGTVAGGAQNSAEGTGWATVGGGEFNTAGGFATVGGGEHNSASGDNATVAGGYDNVANGIKATAGGGFGNIASGNIATVGGGLDNSASGDYATVGGGSLNTASGNDATVGGGSGNLAGTNYATIPGGYQNIASGAYSFAAGNFAQATNDGAFVWADDQGPSFSSTGNDQFSVRARGGVRFVTDGAGVTIDGQPVLAASSGIIIEQNTNDAPNIIEGSSVNYVSNSVIGATIGGGGLPGTNYYGDSYTNSVTANYGTVSGGVGNTVSGNSCSVGGGDYNSASGGAATVGGGYYNSARHTDATVGGGYNNVASGYSATVGGGDNNTASSYATTVGGGEYNSATNAYATVPGGYNNTASGEASFAAGTRARAMNDGSFVWSDGQVSTFSSTTNDEFSIRAQNGVRIQSDKGIHLNAANAPLIVRDYDPFATNAPNGKAGIGRWGLFMEPYYLTVGIPDTAGRYFQVAKYSTNGTYSTLMKVDQSGDVYAKAFNVTSDRNAKEHFTAINVKTILKKVLSLPVTEWNYKTDSSTQKHVGPMAQDFHAAFGLNGSDDKHISVVDEGGVALASIQGLNQKLQAESKAKDDEIQKQNTEIELLRQTVTQLKHLVNRLAGQKKAGER